MSDALNYLVKARPEAVGHYFAFLKDCGRHLDPKTRNLISVITKVDAQTERGFRQYLGRALREGCTRPEVLDALLMAFPTLGLAKIVWAVDLILAMDLPEFQPGALRRRRGDWHDLAATRGVKPGAGAAHRMRRPRRLRLPRPEGLARVRQPLPAPDHRHPAPGAGGHHPHLPQAPLGVRHPHRRVHRQRRRARCASGNRRVSRGRLQAFW